VKAKLEISALRMRATTFAEKLYCYGDESTRRHFRSTFEYRPKTIAVCYSDTRYIMPKRLTSTYVSHVDVSGPHDSQRPKLYKSSVEVSLVTVSKVVVVGF